MANTLPHMEDSNLTNYYPPKGEFIQFNDDAHYEEKVREWGLVTTKEIKKEFWYKGEQYQRLVIIKGYEEYGSFHVAIIEFQDGNLSCIHPDYLKQMQSSNYSKTYGEGAEEESEDKPKKKTSPKSSKPKESKPKKEKLKLPEEKVHFTAKVKDFTVKTNPFTGEDEEVVLYENVAITGEHPLTLGDAWSSYSNTLKKAELSIGDDIEFDAKITDKKKFDKDIIFKINNPSKIEKK